MNFDPRQFSPVSIVDTCSIWHMLSSRRLNQAAIRAKRHFCVTPVVLYECLQKPRTKPTGEQLELMQRLRSEIDSKRFPVQECSLEDLMAISAKAPGRLGSGELSCIATAYKIRSIAFMTDEKLARKFAKNVLSLPVETTPRLYGFLHYHMHLGDADHSHVIEEHERYERRPLTKFFNEAFEEAMRCRSMDHGPKRPC